MESPILVFQEFHHLIQEAPHFLSPALEAPMVPLTDNLPIGGM